MVKKIIEQFTAQREYLKYVNFKSLRYFFTHIFRTSETLEVLKEIVMQEGTKDIIPENFRGLYENESWNGNDTRQQYENLSGVILDLFIDQEKLQGTKLAHGQVCLSQIYKT
mgnify:CR=1 FL=1